MESKGGKGSYPITGCEVTSCGEGEERRGEGCVTSSGKHGSTEMGRPAGQPFVSGNVTSCSLACPHMPPCAAPGSHTYREDTLRSGPWFLLVAGV